jgi:NCS1 family nucleobase:cation symporter-1
VLIAMTVGIICVYFLMNLIGRPSQVLGIPYPVFARVSFGVRGANLAALARGVVGVVWYGVQTYFASKAVQVLVLTFFPGAASNAAMLIVAYFAALLLNFGDFSRFADSQRSMKIGNFLGLPLNFFVFALITVIVTSGSVSVFGGAVMDPLAIVEKINNPIVAVLGSLTFMAATMGINIVANFVSPAYDIANLYPQKITFKIGGLIASILSVLVCP